MAKSKNNGHKRHADREKDRQTGGIAISDSHKMLIVSAERVRHREKERRQSESK